MSHEEPSRLGRYELREVLGRGAMGVVYKAHDSFLDRTVAVKTYRQDVAASEGVRRRFEREVKTTSKLSHPNIVTVYDGGLEGDIPFLAMEFVAGSTLEAEMIRRGRMPLGDALAILFQICEGLAYAHGKGVIHRDLKPANILLSETGQPKIADFGVAKVMTGDTSATLTPVGTPSYMSPEQVGGKPIDARADIFSLGILAYELLTGVKPFAGETWTAVLFKIMNEEPPPPSQVCSDLPKAVDRVIAHAVAKEAAARTPDVASFARELREAVSAGHTAEIANRPITRGAARSDEGLQLSLEPGDLEPFQGLSPEKPGSPSRRPRWGLFLLFLLMVLAIAGLGGLLVWQQWGKAPVPPEASSGAPTSARPVVEPTVAPRPTTVSAQPVAEAPSPQPAEHPLPTAAPKAQATPTLRPTAKPSPTPAPTRPPAPTAVPVVPLATMDVIASPPGAEVLVNGVLKGRAPMRVSDLPPGTYEFEVRKSGYVPYKRSAELEGNSQYEMKVTLVQVVNSLRILSDPPGASITVNGEARGQAPLLLSELRNGTYEVTATLEGRSTTKKIDLEGGDLGELQFSFAP